MVDSQSIFRIGHIAPSLALSFVRVYDWYYLSALYSLLIEAFSLIFLSHRFTVFIFGWVDWLRRVIKCLVGKIFAKMQMRIWAEIGFGSVPLFLE